ncbi:MAG: RNA-binding protein [Synechococcales bacterium]|nr:RNA-binding protein [Synechococcales bacterium]
MSVRLYIGNLPEDLSRQELEAVFSESGESVSAKLITDRKTGKCRGFGFVTVKNDEEADQFIEKFNGAAVKESSLKIEKALPRTKEKGDEAPAETAATSSGNTSSGNNGGKQRKGNNKGNNNRRSNNSENDSFQPDPRWAQDLERLKQMFAAQTTGS